MGRLRRRIVTGWLLVVTALCAIGALGGVAGASAVSAASAASARHAASPHTATPSAASAAATPTLGIAWALDQQGYGRVKPRTIFNGGDPTGLVSHIRWTRWGQRRAIGHGTGDWVWPGLSVAEGGMPLHATVVAFDLGSCRGRLAYRKIVWYFPGRGQHFDRRAFINICTGHYSTYQPRYAKCGRTTLLSPPGQATRIEATGTTCAAARRTVAGTHAARYAQNGGRFRDGRLYCGSEGAGVVGPPALFECAWGATDILFEVS